MTDDTRHRRLRQAGALALAGILAASVATPTMAAAGTHPGPNSHAVTHPDPNHHAVTHHGARKALLYDVTTSSPGYTCAAGAQPAPGAAHPGFVILNTTGRGYLEVTVVLRGAQPNATYSIWVNQYPGACPLTSATKPNAFTTNARGNGAGHARVELVTGATAFWVSAVSTGNVSILRSPAVTLVLKRAKA